MIIRELIQLSERMSFSDAVKEAKVTHGLKLGRDRAGKALETAGFYTKNGVRGYFLKEDADKTVLDASIYDFTSDNIVTEKKEASATVETSVDASIIEVKPSKVASNAKAVTSEKIGASPLDSIDMLIKQNDIESYDRIYRGFYWDSEVIEFLDKIKHGNKSDLMNEIVLKVLKEKDLL